MATIGFSPAGGALDLEDVLEVTVDHDGTLEHLLVRVTFSGDEQRSELAFFGDLLVAGDATTAPYTKTLVANDPAQYVFTLTREQGWDAAFELRVFTYEAGAWTDAGENYSVTFAPEVEIVDPEDTIGPEDALQLQLTDIAADDVTLFVVLGGEFSEEEGLAYDDSPRSEQVLFGGLVLPPYALEDLGGGLVSITREGGWPLSFLAIADIPSAPSSTAILGVQVFPEEVIDPGAPPSVENVLPAPGTPITSATPLSVDVLDDSGLLRRVLLAVELVGLTELAWDGEQWLGHYAGGGSSRDPIAGGFRFTVLRDGGWSSSPTLRVFAFDQAGNEA